MRVIPITPSKRDDVSEIVVAVMLVCPIFGAIVCSHEYGASSTGAG